jgi:hypothetical protein
MIPFALTSIEGIPEISLTEKIVPVKSFVMDCNCPADPSNESVPFESGYTSNTISVLTFVFAPRKLIIGSVPSTALIFGVIIMFLYVFAMF